MLAEKGGQIGRSLCGGLLQLRDAVCRSAATAQRRPKQGLDLAVGSAARGSFERHNRFVGTVLAEQRMREDQHRIPVGAVRFQDLACKLLGAAELLRPQRLGCFLKCSCK